jgi:tRNA G10  N-methylase Trm11
MWDFKSENTKSFTHGFHTYPAMMIPQIAKKLINDFGQDAEGLFDPYCGTGTSLVEANLAGINSIGSDLNPLARLLAKVKTTAIESQTLKLHLLDFDRYLTTYRFGFQINDSIIAPNYPRIDYWFSKDVRKKLTVIRNYIERIENIDISDFFKVAFSQTIRDTSWTRNNEFKLYRMSKEDMKVFNPDPFGRMEQMLGKNFIGLVNFMEAKNNESTTDIFNLNTIQNIPKKILGKESVDMILTSPPYGDSSTTVAYGQFSTLANQWLGYFENGRELDGMLMGGKRASKLKKFKSEALNDNISEISEIDRVRALDVVSFFSDYEKSIRNISNILKPDGISCYVVSNRKVKGKEIFTNTITKDFFELNGFKHISTYSRNISRKRMPRNNSPTGNAGEVQSLMNKEYIVVMQKK